LSKCTFSTLNAPVSTGIISHTRPSGRVPLPFTSYNLDIITDGGGHAQITNGSNSTNISAMGMIYAGNSSIVSTYIPTVSAQLQSLAQQFMNYRIKKLILRYAPYVGTNTSGNLAIALIPDASSGAGTAPTFNTAASCAGAIVTPVWGQVVKDMTPYINTNWLYTDVSNNSDAEQRQDCFCTIVISSQGTSATSSFGSLVFEGDIEFANLAPNSLV
jgi:hypothetical protein